MVTARAVEPRTQLAACGVWQRPGRPDQGKGTIRHEPSGDHRHGVTWIAEDAADHDGGQHLATHAAPDPLSREVLAVQRLHHHPFEAHGGQLVAPALGFPGIHGDCGRRQRWAYPRRHLLERGPALEVGQGAQIPVLQEQQVEQDERYRSFAGGCGCPRGRSPQPAVEHRGVEALAGPRHQLAVDDGPRWQPCRDSRSHLRKGVGDHLAAPGLEHDTGLMAKGQAAQAIPLGLVGDLATGQTISVQRAWPDEHRLHWWVQRRHRPCPAAWRSVGRMAGMGLILTYRRREVVAIDASAWSPSVPAPHAQGTSCTEDRAKIWS